MRGPHAGTYQAASAGIPSGAMETEAGIARGSTCIARMPNQPIPARFADLAQTFALLTTKTMSSAPVAAPVSPADSAFVDLGEDDYDEIAKQVAAIAEAALLYLDEAGYQTGAGLTEVERIQSDVGRVLMLRG